MDSELILRGCIWQALGPGVYAPVYGYIWKNFSHLVFLPAQFALGNPDTTFTSPSMAYSFFCAMPGSTVRSCSCSALGGSWTNFKYFLREGELKSCGRFASCSSGYFRVLQRGEVCTVDASFAWIARAHCTWKLDIIFTSPL